MIITFQYKNSSTITITILNSGALNNIHIKQNFVEGIKSYFLK